MSSTSDKLSLHSDDADYEFFDEISESSDNKEKISFDSDNAVCEFFTAHSSPHCRASLPDNITSNLPAVKEPRTTRHRRVTFSNLNDICAGVKNTVALSWSKSLSLSSPKEVCNMITPAEVDKKDKLPAPKFTISLSRASSSSSLSSASNLPPAVVGDRSLSWPDVTRILAVEEMRVRPQRRRVSFNLADNDSGSGSHNSIAPSRKKSSTLSSSSKEVCDMIAPTEVDKKDKLPAPKFTISLSRASSLSSLSSASNLPAVVGDRSLSWPDVTRILAVEEMRMRPHRRRVSFNLADNDSGSGSHNSIAPSRKKSSTLSSSSKEVCDMIAPMEVIEDRMWSSGSAITPFRRSISLSSASNLHSVAERCRYSLPDNTSNLPAIKESRTTQSRRVSFNLTDNSVGSKNSIAPSRNKPSLSFPKELCDMTAPTEVNKKDTMLRSGSAFTPFRRSISLSSASNLPPAVVEHRSFSWPDNTSNHPASNESRTTQSQRVSFNLTNNGDGFKNTIHAHRYNHISSTRNDVSCPKFIKQEASNVKDVSKFSDRLNPDNDCYYLEDDKVSHPSHKETNTNLRKAKILLGIPPDSTATEVYGGRKIPLTDERRLVRVDSSQSAAKLSPRFTANSRYHDLVQAKSKSFHSRRGSASIYKEEKNSRHSDAAQIKSKSFHCVDNPMRGSVSFHMDEKVDTQELKSGLKIPLTDKTRRLIRNDSSQLSTSDSSQLSTVDVDLSPRTTATNIQELKVQLRPSRQEWPWSANGPIATNVSHLHAQFNGDRNLDGQIIQVDKDGFDVDEIAFPRFEKDDNDSKLTAELDDDEPTLNDEDTLLNTLDTVDLVAEVKRVWRHVQHYEKKKHVKKQMKQKYLRNDLENIDEEDVMDEFTPDYGR
jgi:hypothetical protein